MTEGSKNIVLGNMTHS